MRALRRTLVVLLVLAGLFVAADRIALHLAESRAADRIENARGVASTDSTSVDIRGFPFLTQVAGKNLDRVDVELTGMTTASADRRITVSRMAATLRDVRLGDDYGSAVARDATGTAEISYADLNAIAPDGIEVSYAGKERARKNQVRITASIEVLGRRLEFPEPIYSTVRVLGDDRLELRADVVPGASIPGAEAQVRQRVDFGRGVDGLPSGLALEKAEATKGGLRFTVTGTDVPLG
ncbi:DUF2993 domain-containing protein [Streptomyces sp. TR06-5]|uniref:LmeA family phospholipid-binding protein n=1 Tax=unclassified Streptomyces TaxID=2593676 RepID=UPI0039A01DDD